MGRTKNPFIFGRIEFERNALLYMREELLDWVSPNPELFEGPRGSGKSSILRSMSWEVAWGLSGIKVTGPPEVIAMFKSPHHIAVYRRVEDMDVGYWDDWRESVGTRHAQRFFGTYLEYLYLDLFLKAFHEIRKKTGVLFLNAKAEASFVGALLPQCFPRKKHRPQLEAPTFLSLRSLVTDIHLGIRGLVFENASAVDLKASYSVIGPGCLMQVMGEALTERFPWLESWALIPLLDDCNLLHSWQAEVVNTAVARVRAPVAYKLTSVAGQYRTRGTLNWPRTMAEADISTVTMPPNKDPTHERQVSMAEGVCRTRLQSHLALAEPPGFDLKRFLGEFRLETSLLAKLRKSEKPLARKLLQRAHAEQEKPDAPSATAAWLRLKRVRETSETESDQEIDADLARRKNASVYLNKWKHVAAVAMCKELRFGFPYHGWRVIMRLSGGSIREFLRLMSKIWDAAGMGANDFMMQSPIDPTIQGIGARKAAQKNFDAIDAKPLLPDLSLKDMCDRLGNLFAKCQSWPYVATAPETAAIRIHATALTDELLAIIDRAVTAGVLLTKEVEKTGAIDVGLHPILAPKFGISFRQPFYYPEPVTSSDEVVALLLGDKEQSKKATKNILSARVGRYTKACRPRREVSSSRRVEQATLFDPDES